ncbi:hypothetical protein BVRB_1g002990 [Beta vulgaris subsp. vulgaris]|nr:hypothetical protein BVRB_1g002990 [Beta vulgaris subsp. vulgaris]
MMNKKRRKGQDSQSQAQEHPKAVFPVLGAGHNPTLAVCIKRKRRRPKSTTQDKYYSAAASNFNLSLLPREIIFNILLLLPASILQDIIRLVCKDWYARVTDPLFTPCRLHRRLLVFISLFKTEACSMLS